MNMLKLLQKQKIISVRDFIRQFSKMTSEPENKIYTIVKNGKKVGIFIPEKYEDEIFDMPEMYQKEKKYKSLFTNYHKIAFKGPKNLSQNIDRILYGKGKK